MRKEGLIAPEVGLEARPTKIGTDRDRDLAMYFYRKKTGAGTAPLRGDVWSAERSFQDVYQDFLSRSLSSPLISPYNCEIATGSGISIAVIIHSFDLLQGPTPVALMVGGSYVERARKPRPYDSIR